MFGSIRQKLGFGDEKHHSSLDDDGAAVVDVVSDVQCDGDEAPSLLDPVLSSTAPGIQIGALDPASC